MLGLVASLKDRYLIRSNRESGLGRYDLIMIPNDKSERGFIFEFKAVNTKRKETFEIAIENAIYQMKDKKYNSELIQHGVKDIIYMVMVFKGKEVKVVEMA